MRFGVLGTGMVGQTLGGKLVELGHEVTMGSRQPGNEKAVAWAASAGERASEGSFADAARLGKVLIDVANPLDFGAGRPPILAVSNDDSLGEQIQTAFPEARVVKALNTVNAAVMVEPGALGQSTAIFVCGNDHEAKARVIELLETFGWLSGDIVDLGDISAARGPEMYLVLWLRLMGALE